MSAKNSSVLTGIVLVTPAVYRPDWSRQCIKTATAFCGQVSLPSPWIDWIEGRGKPPIIFPAREARTRSAKAVILLAFTETLRVISGSVAGVFWTGSMNETDSLHITITSQMIPIAYFPTTFSASIKIEPAGCGWGRLAVLAVLIPRRRSLPTIRIIRLTRLAWAATASTPSIRTGPARFGLGLGWA